jgi:RHS repeat-associated protein
MNTINVKIYNENPSVFPFTAKELDPETGLYYFGARYLDPRTSRWLSTDPAMGEYVPGAPVNDEVKKQNQNLPGMGGVFNIVNLHTYHYAGNNPVKYVDPDGRMPVPKNNNEYIQILRQKGYSDVQIANNFLKAWGVGLSVEEIGNIIFNETRSLSGEHVQEARENIANVVINGELKWGSEGRERLADTSAKTVTDIAKKQDPQQYADSQTAATQAVLSRAIHGDPTEGAEHFNFRPDNKEGNFLGILTIKTQVGPLDNSYPRKPLNATGNYANTYKEP